MALPKAKVKERLKAKFPGVNLSQKRIDAIADKLKLPEDSEDEAIDERLDELNDVFSFADMAKSDDRLRTLEAKEKQQKPTDEPDPKPSDDPKPTDQPDIAKIIQAALAPLQQEIAGLKASKTGDTRRTQLEEKLKDVNPKYKESVLKQFGRMAFDKDEDFDTYLEEIEESAKDFQQSEANDGLGGFKPPVQAKGGSTKKQISTEEADSILDKVL